MADAARIHKELGEIYELARAIEEVPNLPQDVWSMKRIDQKARRIQKLCRSIADQIGTGHGGRGGTRLG